MPAVLIPSIIGAASSIGSAVAQHKAASSAAKTQQAATDRAVAAQQNGYAQQQALYNRMQGGAVSTLGRLLTPGGGSAFAAGPQQPFSLGAPSVGPQMAVPRMAPNVPGGMAPNLPMQPGRPMPQQPPYTLAMPSPNLPIRY